MLIPFGILSAAGAGGAVAGGAYELLETTILGSAASSVTFTGLGSYTDYKHLQLRYTVRSSSTGGNLVATVNGDTGANYRSHRIYGDGSSVASQDFTNNFLRLGASEVSTSTANSFAAGVVDFLDFSSTTKNTTTRNLSGTSGAIESDFVQLGSALYINTSAVTSLNFFSTVGNLVAGSRLSLYGIRG